MRWQDLTIPAVAQSRVSARSAVVAVFRQVVFDLIQANPQFTKELSSLAEKFPLARPGASAESKLCRVFAENGL